MEEIILNNDLNKPQNNKNNKKVLICVICILVVLIVVVLMVVSVPRNSTLSSNYLNYSNYTKIENGMSYSQVVEILDDNQGVLDTSSSFGGYTLSYYTWSNSSGTKCIVVGFENGKVCAKSQYGL